MNSCEPLSPPYLEIREGIEAGQVIPFLGAGASLGRRTPSKKKWAPQSAYLPTGSELAKYLAGRIEFPPDEPPDLAKVAQYFEVILGREPLTERLHSIFDGDFPITPL